MSQKKEYRLSDQVKRVMMLEKITPEELAEMLEQAAITTHDRGNRRFNIWVFQLNDNYVYAMTHLEGRVETRVDRRGRKDDLITHDEHGACEGSGCAECGYIGEIKMIYKADPVVAAKKAASRQQ